MALNNIFLKARIKEVYGSQEGFAKAIGRSTSNVNKKLNSTCDITREEILQWADILKIDICDIPTYFFV